MLNSYQGSSVNSYGPGTPPRVGRELSKRTRNGTRATERVQPAVLTSEVENPARIFAFYCTLGFVFVRFSMIHEVIAATYGINTYLLYIFGPPAMLGMFLSGGLRRCLSALPTRLALGFVFWMVLATPFSAWKGGSLQFTLSYMRTEVPILFLIAGLVITWKECVMVANTIAMAAIVNIALGRLFALQVEGRLLLSLPGSSISNSNDYAAHLLLGLGFLLAFTLRCGWILRVLFSSMIAAGLFLVLLTGSRGALIALVCVGIYTLWYATPSQRVLAGFGLLAGGVILFSILPPDTKTRLTNFSMDEDNEASESAQSRKYLLQEGIRYALHNPLFGVGPGQFSSYEGGLSQEEGRRGQWHEAHNSYVQAAAECGLPAAFFFTGALISAYRMLSRIFRKSRLFPEAKHVTVLSFPVLIGVVGFCIAIGFLNFYPKFYLLTIVSFAVAFARTADMEFAQVFAAREKIVPVPETASSPRNRRQSSVVGRRKLVK